MLLYSYLSKNKKYFLLFFLFLFFFSLQFLKNSQKNVLHPLVIRDEQEKEYFLSVYLAKNKKSREKGLSHFSSLKKNQGMLFIFPNEEKHAFWMKEMKFPIDILWFDTKKSLCWVKENARPEDFPNIYIPKCSAKYVLEVPAGTYKDFFHKKQLFLEKIFN